MGTRAPEPVHRSHRARRTHLARMIATGGSRDKRGNMAHHFNSFANGAALAEALADKVATALGAAIAARGEASIAVSGGSTPKLFFQTLSRKQIDWSKVA